MTRPMLPLELRSEQGNPEITVYCPKCRERTVPSAHGFCNFCDTDLSPEMNTSIEEPRSRPRREYAQAITGYLQTHGTATVTELMAALELTSSLTYREVYALETMGRLVRSGRKRSGSNGGRAAIEYRLAGTPVPSAAAGSDRDRYLAALLAWVERASAGEAPGPPKHVYTRLEHLLAGR